MIRNMILTNRSYRRFFQEAKIDLDTLYELVDLARLSSSALNMQPLKYILSVDEDKNEKIFRNLTWAIYLKDWGGPKEGEKPTAYVIMLGDTRITTNYYCDHGIAAQSILLGAIEKGYGGCIIASVNRQNLAKDLNIPAHFEILQVIALGKPNEKVVLEDIKNDGDFKYWRDEEQVHHVPKRKLKDIIVEL